MKTKVCKICNEELGVTEYYKNKNTKDGLHTYCKGCARAKTKKYESVNKEKLKVIRKEYRKNNREYFNKKTSEWNKRTKYGENYQRERFKNDPQFKLNRSVRTLIKNSFKNSVAGSKRTVAKKTEELLGCDMAFFIKHIESLFTDRMTLENHGEWHLDHIIPISSAKTTEDVVRLSHYTNYQPLWAIDNLRKYNKM